MKKILNNLKNDSALTIVEVLVAVILTAIVMLHGTSFFGATWRLSVESKEYNMVLSDVVSNLEKCSSIASDTIPTPAGEYVVTKRILRNKYTVTYELEKQSMYPFGYFFLTSKARWRYGGDVHSSRVINIRSAYIPKNRLNEYVI